MSSGVLGPKLPMKQQSLRMAALRILKSLLLTATTVKMSYYFWLHLLKKSRMQENWKLFLQRQMSSFSSLSFQFLSSSCTTFFLRLSTRQSFPCNFAFFVRMSMGLCICLKLLKEPCMLYNSALSYVNCYSCKQVSVSFTALTDALYNFFIWFSERLRELSPI